MTDITLEQRAQLAYETWRDTPADGDSAWPKWLAVAEALRLSAGADGWTLELYRDRDGELGVWAKQEGGSRVWIARAAAPRHEPGEG